MSTIIFNIFLLLLAVRNICDAADTSNQDSTYYDRKTNIARPRVAGVESLNPAKLISFSGGSCQCANLACNCCTGVRVPKLKFDREVCTTVSYLKKDIGIEASVNVNQKQIYSTSVSARNPPAMCTSIPDVPLIQLCLRFHDITINGNGLHFCTDLETHASKLPVLKLHFNCAQI